jgi:hypothetical protein
MAPEKMSKNLVGIMRKYQFFLFENETLNLSPFCGYLEVANLII